jgi:predicted aspartyl protease
MLSGEVTDSLEPVVKCVLLGEGGERYEGTVIDTGFNGYISIPFNLLQLLGWEHIGYEEYEIATGDIVRERVYFGRLRFMDTEHEVIAVASHARDVLIGTRLLNASNSILEINFPMRTVQIVRLST